MKKRKQQSWPEGQRDYLRQNADRKPADLRDGLEAKFGVDRSYSSVLNQLAFLGLRPPGKRRRKRWEDSEIQYLEENHKEKTPNELAKALDRPYPSVRKVLNDRGLSAKVRRRKRWTQNDKDYALENHGSQTIAQMARALATTPRSVEAMLTRLRKKVRMGFQADVLDEPSPNFTYRLSMWYAEPEELMSMEQVCIDAGMAYCIVKGADGRFAIFRSPI